MMASRLEQQITFFLELDKLKQVLRRTRPGGSTRYEDSAQHSWHLAMMALILTEHADAPVDANRVLQMVLIHDVVEIDAGDTFLYDVEARRSKQEDERAAAERIFGLLPVDQAMHFRELWEEYEARQTPEAQFAYALDRLMPLLQNYHNQGSTWQENGVHKGQVWQLNQPIGEASARLWETAQRVITDAVAQGYLAPQP
ncbi:MAG: HD domain-containing protein [Caldilineaceae bacterium]|nr:HD domain-containing protein [Caldilineaceae bacterium]